MDGVFDLATYVVNTCRYVCCRQVCKHFIVLYVAQTHMYNSELQVRKPLSNNTSKLCVVRFFPRLQSMYYLLIWSSHIIGIVVFPCIVSALHLSFVSCVIQNLAINSYKYKFTAAAGQPETWPCARALTL